MRFGAFVITYNRPDQLKRTIQLIIDQTRPPDLILIVDNGDTKSTSDVIQDFKQHHIIHKPLGGNLGPATAEGFGLQWFDKRGYDWIYWVDDDDPPYFSHTLERLLDIIASIDDRKDVAAVGAVGTLFDWTHGETIRLPDQALDGVVEVDNIGGNGQLILRREAVRAIGLPDHRLFIDFEDTEYCLRLRRAGYRLLVDGDLMREYRTKAGRLQLKQQRLPRLRKHPSPWRRYYSTRNYIFSMNKTFHRPDLARREAFKALGRSILYLRHGLKCGPAYSRLQFRAVLDGYLGRMGRTVMPTAKYEGNSKQT